MSTKAGKILLALGVLASALGFYMLVFETGRVYFYAQRLIPGAAITLAGVTLLAIGAGKLVRPIAGIGVFVTVAGLAALTVYLRTSDQLARAQDYADREAVMRALLPVCEGQALPHAATRTERAPRKTVLIVTPSEGASYEWGADIDPAWRPRSVEETQLVACFATEKRLLETCAYRDIDDTGVTVPIYQYVITAKVYEAKTGTLLGTKVFEGDRPSTECSESITVEDGRAPARTGGMPPQAEQLAFVRGFVENVERP